MKIVIYKTLGVVCLILGALGIVLPIMPTAPFIIAAAFFFSRSSPVIHRWLRRNRYFGPALRNWEDKGTISRKAKILATTMIWFGLAYPLGILDLPLWAKITAPAFALCVTVFLWTRPSA